MAWYYIEYELEGEITVYSYHIEAPSKQLARALVEKQEMAQINLSTVWVEAMTEEAHMRYNCPVLHDDAMFSVLLPHKEVLDIDVNGDTFPSRCAASVGKVEGLLGHYAGMRYLDSLPDSERTKVTCMGVDPVVTATSTDYLVQFYPEGEYP